jgi:hypothetical protein
MKRTGLLFKVILLINLCLGYSVGDLGQKSSISAKNRIHAYHTTVYRNKQMKAEVITWRDESAITILDGERILFRKSFFSDYGYSGSFIKDGAWSANGSCFAFRLLSSGGHMPYRTPVKIFCVHNTSKALIDAESLIKTIPNISDIFTSSHTKPYLKWLSDTKLLLSAVSYDKKSDSGMYVIDLNTMSAKRFKKSQMKNRRTNSDISVHYGSFKRKAILNAVRQKIKTMHHLDVIFIVRYLKAKNGWAWAHLLPQSRDGNNHYEDIFVLLHKTHNAWHIAELPCAEEDDPECITSPGYFSNLRKRFPDIPEEILPKEK